MKQRISIAIAIVFGSIACGDSVGYGPAASMVSYSPQNQKVLAGTKVPIPPAVQVVDAGGVPVPNVTVTFAVLSGDGAIIGAVQMTDAQGVATVGGWTIGGYGRQTIVAMSDGLPTIELTAIGIAPPEGVLAFDIDDAVGDSKSYASSGTGTMDIVAVRGDFKVDSLIVTVSFKDELVVEISEFFVELKFDTDLNLATPLYEEGPGFEGRVWFSTGEVETYAWRIHGPTTQIISSVDSHSITFRIPMSAMLYEVGKFLLSAEVSTYDQGEDFDVAPNEPATVHAIP
jgi:hypothetical protein